MSRAPEPPDEVIIGVAIAVPEPHATMIREARLSFGDAQGHHIPTHVTLLPPTALARAQLDAVDAHLREVAGEGAPFCIELRGTDSFRPVSSVVFVPLVKGGNACASLSHAVRQGPLARDLPFAYHPHVTIAHNIAENRLDAAEAGMRWVHAGFEVDRFGLYTRCGEVAWMHRRDYHLAMPGGVAPDADGQGPGGGRLATSMLIERSVG